MDKSSSQPTAGFSIGMPILILRVGLIGATTLASISWLTQIPQVDRPSDGLNWETLNVDSEFSVATWASAAGLLIAALMIFSIASTPGQRDWRKHWLALAGIFTFLSMDESLSFHEKAVEPLRDALNTGGIFFFAWVIPAGMAVAILALALRRFVWALEPSVRSIALGAAGLYLAGALGMELVGGVVADSTGQRNAIYVSIVTVEELLEMLGITVFLYGLARLQVISRTATARGQ